MSVRALLLAGSLTVAAATPGVAEAEEDEAVRLEYSVANGLRCPDRSDIELGVVAHLGRNPFVDSAATSVHAQVAATGSGIVVRLRVREGGALRGERELSSPSCSDVAEAMIFAIALAIDPLAGPSSATGADGDRDEVSVADEATPAAAPRPVPASDPPRTIYSATPQLPLGPAPEPAIARWTAHAAAAIDHGLNPGGSFGLRGFLGVDRDWQRIGAELQVHGRDADLDGTDLEARRMALAGVGCGRRRFFFGCVTVTIGQTQFDLRGAVPDEGKASGLVLLSGVRAGASVPLGALELSVYGEAALAAVRPVLESGGRERWRGSRVPVGLALTVGMAR